MASDVSMSSGGPLAEGLEHLRRSWGWLLALGIVLIALGMVALAVPLVVTLTTVLLFAILLIVGGAAEIASAFWARKWSGFMLHVLSGVLHVIVGVIMVEKPALAAAAFTLMLAVFLMVGGLFRLIVAMVQRFPQWGWIAFSGAVTLLLGILIWREWPEISFWVIGTFVGIELFFDGWSWVMLALAVRRLPTAAA